MSQIWGEATQLPAYSTDYLLKPGQADAEMFNSLQQYAPGAIQAINQQAPQTAQSQLAAEQAVLPGYNQIGEQNVGLADKYQRQLDPEFYSNRALISQAIGKYLGSYDPTSLTPTEEAQIARGINATTGPISGSNMNTIRNAQVFGQAGTERWKNFGQAVTQAAQALPQLRSGISGFDVSQTGAGATEASKAANNALNANFGFSTSALGDIAGNVQARVSKGKDPWDKIKAGSPSSVLGGIL